MQIFCLFLTIPLLNSVPANAFSIQSAISISNRQSTLALLMSSGKGFGENSNPATAKKVKSTVTVPAPTMEAESEQQPSSYVSKQETPSAGQRALERMRRDREEATEAEAQKVRELMLQDKLVQETPAVIPEKVAQRMGKRMLPFVGVPLFMGMGSFVAFWYFATYKNIEFQPAAVATATVFFLVVGLLGITYSVLSASWDPDREGDLFGADEFKTNMDSIRAGLSRSRENVILRERMEDKTIKDALIKLESKEKAELKRNQSFGEKLEDELS
jgi:hypothetical protein